jgi:hypothetical protein
LIKAGGKKGNETASIKGRWHESVQEGVKKKFPHPSGWRRFDPFLFNGKWYSRSTGDG